jgi:dTDP-glucose 4,6-dehydratase
MRTGANNRFTDQPPGRATGAFDRSIVSRVLAVSAWSGKAVSVTGAGGFIGSHLVEELVARGSSVRAMVVYNSRGDRGALEWIDPARLTEVDVQAGDVRDRDAVAQLVEATDVVFHLAALISIPYSYTNPRSFLETNVMGTLNVAQACREASVTRLVHTSTSEVYGSAQQIPINEDHPLVGQSPYAASKIAADQLVTSFHRSFALPASVLRPFNTYGPRQSARAVLPTIVSQALAGSIVRLGSLEPRRDLTYVADTVTGFLAIAEEPRTVGETLQLGTGQDVSIRDLVEEVANVLGRELEVVSEDQRRRPPDSDVMRLVSSPKRMRELTGWAPAVPLRDGIARLARWIEMHPERYRIGEYAV